MDLNEGECVTSLIPGYEYGHGSVERLVKTSMNPRLLMVALACLAGPFNDATAERTSPHVSALILAGLPRFDEVSIPRNGSDAPFDGIVLPTVTVRESKFPPISDHDLRNKAGRELHLRKRYPGASFRGQDPDNSPIPNYAALMYRDDLRLEQIAMFTRLQEAVTKQGDLAEAKKLKAELRRTFLRQPDWRTEGMDKVINHWRN